MEESHGGKLQPEHREPSSRFNDWERTCGYDTRGELRSFPLTFFRSVQETYTTGDKDECAGFQKSNERGYIGDSGVTTPDQNNQAGLVSILGDGVADIQKESQPISRLTAARSVGFVTGFTRKPWTPSIFALRTTEISPRAVQTIIGRWR